MLQVDLLVVTPQTRQLVSSRGDRLGVTFSRRPSCFAAAVAQAWIDCAVGSNSRGGKVFRHERHRVDGLRQAAVRRPSADAPQSRSLSASRRNRRLPADPARRWSDQFHLEGLSSAGLGQGDDAGGWRVHVPVPAARGAGWLSSYTPRRLPRKRPPRRAARSWPSELAGCSRKGPTGHSLSGAGRWPSREKKGDAEQKVDADQQHALEPGGLAICGNRVDNERRPGDGEQVERVGEHQRHRTSDQP